MLVSQILKSKSLQTVVTVPREMKISDAAKLLSEKRIGTVLVSSDGKTVDGILSERDIVREVGARGARALDARVEQFMTAKLVTCGLAHKAEDILQQMTEGRFRHMPVLEDGLLIGLISLGDVVKANLLQVSMEKDALEHMIMGH